MTLSLPQPSWNRPVRAAVAGTATQITDAVAGWETAGVDEVIVPDWTLGEGAERLETMDRLRTEVFS